MRSLVLRRRSLVFALGAGSVLGAFHSRADELPAASESPILSISGKIKNTNHGGQVVFDLPMIERLGMTTVITKTPWYKEAQRFEGVPLSRLMDYVGAFGSRVLVSALNDYTSELPISDFAQYGPLLAMKRNGEYMPVSDKGPLFVIYPFDDNPELRQDKFYMRSVWQVSSMEVR